MRRRSVRALPATAAIVATAVLGAALGVGLMISVEHSHAASPSTDRRLDFVPPPTVADAAPPTVAPPAPAPTPAPPFAVGIVHVTYTDTTRPTDARGDTPASSSRTIPVTIRYPVAGTVGDDEAPAVPAVTGSFPLVVFAHGFDVSADTYALLEHQLASAGFIVAAPDFPLTSSAIPGPAIEDDVSNQAADVSFVITSLLDPTQAPAAVAHAIDGADVGVIGHSDGGVTAAAVAYNSTVADPRVHAAVILSGAESDYDGSWFTTQSPPLLAIHGTDDEVNPFADSTTLYDGATGPAMLVAVNGGSHLGPFTTDAEEPDVAMLVADFLRAHVGGDANAASRLVADANVDGELSLVASSDGP